MSKQVKDGTLKVEGSNDVLTMALETSEHGGRVRGVGGFVTPSFYFNQPRRRRQSVEESIKESVKRVLEEEKEEREKIVADLNKFWMERFAALEAALNSNSQPTPHIVGNASEKASYSTSKGISMKDEERQFFNVHEEDNGEGKYKDSKVHIEYLQLVKTYRF